MIAAAAGGRRTATGKHLFGHFGELFFGHTLVVLVERQEPGHPGQVARFFEWIIAGSCPGPRDLEQDTAARRVVNRAIVDRIAVD